MELRLRVYCGHYAGYHTQGEHTAVEGVAGVVAELFIAEHQRSVVDTHRHTRALFFEGAHHFHQTRVEMR